MNKCQGETEAVEGIGKVIISDLVVAWRKEIIRGQKEREVTLVLFISYDFRAELLNNPILKYRRGKEKSNACSFQIYQKKKHVYTMCNLLLPLMIIKSFSVDQTYGKIFKRISNLMLAN